MKNAPYNAINTKNLEKSNIKYDKEGFFELRRKEAQNFKNLMLNIDSNNLTKRILGHEANTIVNYFTSVDTLKEHGTMPKEMLEEMKDMAIKGSYALEDLKPLLKSSLNENEVRKGQTNTYEVFNKMKTNYGLHASKKNITTTIEGDKDNQNISNAHMTTLAHTLYGDSIKWAPNGSQIYTKIENNPNDFTIILENSVGEIATENIGEGLGTGSAYVDKFLEATGGVKINYDTSQLRDSNEKIWGTKIIIPKEKDTLAELVQ